jgi:hypothetical protein
LRPNTFSISHNAPKLKPVVPSTMHTTAQYGIVTTHTPYITKALETHQ